VVDLDTLNLYNHGITSGNLSLASVQTNEYYKVLRREHEGPVNTQRQLPDGIRGNIVTLNNIGWDATNATSPSRRPARERAGGVRASHRDSRAWDYGAVATGLTGSPCSAVASGGARSEPTVTHREP